MSPSDAQWAMYFLSRVAPRGEQEEHQLLQLLNALNNLVKTGKNTYNSRSATAA